MDDVPGPASFHAASCPPRQSDDSDEPMSCTAASFIDSSVFDLSNLLAIDSLKSTREGVRRLLGDTLNAQRVDRAQGM